MPLRTPSAAAGNGHGHGHGHGRAERELPVHSASRAEMTSKVSSLATLRGVVQVGEGQIEGLPTRLLRIVQS